MTLDFVNWHMITLFSAIAFKVIQGELPSLNRFCLLWYQVVQPRPFIWPAPLVHGHLLYVILAHFCSLYQLTLNAWWMEFPTGTQLAASSLSVGSTHSISLLPVWMAHFNLTSLSILDPASLDCWQPHEANLWKWHLSDSPSPHLSNPNDWAPSLTQCCLRC